MYKFPKYKTVSDFHQLNHLGIYVQEIEINKIDGSFIGYISRCMECKWKHKKVLWSQKDARDVCYLHLKKHLHVPVIPLAIAPYNQSLSTNFG